jgi:drug/metabolite transporter (DMT)-like permease
MTLVEFGFTTAMITLPVVLALTCGVAWPLFRFWVRQGYSSVAAYVGGGVIVATIGAVIIGAAHSFGFLIGTDFWFAMLLLAVSGPVAGFVVWYVLQRLTKSARTESVVG